MKVDEQDDVTSKARGSVATLAESPARCGKDDAVFFFKGNDFVHTHTIHVTDIFTFMNG